MEVKEIMYFQQLRRLGNYDVNPVAINLLDSWLAIQRKAILKNLSPVSFSNQSNIDLELAIDMFSLSSKSNIGVLKPIFKPICPICDNQNGFYSSLENVPNTSIICRHCGNEYIPSSRSDYIEIVFERCLEPEQPFVSESAREMFVVPGGNLGKVDSLRVSDIIKRPNNARGHLLSKLDSSYEAAQ